MTGPLTVAEVGRLEAEAWQATEVVKLAKEVVEQARAEEVKAWEAFRTAGQE
jgi:hypothetical protein